MRLQNIRVYSVILLKPIIQRILHDAMLDELRKRDKMQGLLFPNKFNKFNNTGARMLDSIYHMALKLLKNHSFGLKTSSFCDNFKQSYNGRHYVTLLNL